MPRAYAVRVGSTGQLDLPRIAWEGGPGFYNQFSTMAGTEWTSDSFFPIAYWGPYVNTQSWIEHDAELGINCMMNAYNVGASSASWLRSNGIWNCSGTMPGAGSEWIGITVDDEIDLWAGSGWDPWTGNTGFVPNVCVPDDPRHCGFTATSGLWGNYLPLTDGRMRFMNWGKQCMMFASTTQSRTFVNGTRSPDALADWDFHMQTADVYFYSDTNIASEAPNFLSIPSGQVRRAYNYGTLMDRLRELSMLDAASPHCPFGVIVELAGQGNGLNVYGQNVAGAVWATLIREARMVLYFSHGFANTTDNPGNGIPDILNQTGGVYEDTQDIVGALNAEVQGFAPILNTQSYQWTFGSNLNTMLKAKDGFAYIFAMAARESTHSTAARTFTLPAAVHGTTVEVVGEARSLGVSGGSFTDSFANEYTHHVYKVAI